MLDVISDVIEERKRQDEKWGAGRDQDNLVWSSILTEEVGEAAEQSLWVHFDGIDEARLYKELIQIAAVAVAWAENLRKRGVPTVVSKF
jgi:hypothetical protein